jgi:hypothetical protein
MQRDVAHGTSRHFAALQNLVANGAKRTLQPIHLHHAGGLDES